MLYYLHTILPVHTYILVVAPCYPSATKHLSFFIAHYFTSLISDANYCSGQDADLKLLPKWLIIAISDLVQLGELISICFCVGLIKWYSSNPFP